VNGRRVGGEMCLYDIQSATGMQITDGNTHTRLLHAVFAQSYAALHSLLRECSVAVVVEEKTRSRITRDIQVRPSVPVQIGSNGRQPVTTLDLTDARGCSDIR